MLLRISSSKFQYINDFKLKYTEINWKFLMIIEVWIVLFYLNILISDNKYLLNNYWV